MSILDLKLKDQNFDFTNDEINMLISLKKKNGLYQLKPILKVYWELIRISNRIINPKGLIINVPFKTTEELHQFKIQLEAKVGLLFRFVKINSSSNFKTNFLGLIGSTLVINNKKDFKSKRAIIANWKGAKFQTVHTNGLIDNEQLVNAYFKVILGVLEERKGLTE